MALRFKKFVTEMAVASNKLDKTVEIFKRLLERKLGTKMYRYGGPDGYAGFGRYTSILYIYDKNKAISFDYYKGKIETISLFKKFKLGAAGDFVIHVEGLNFVAAAYKLLDIIANPKMGEYAFFPEMLEEFEEVEQLSEASTKMTPSEFHAMIQQNFNGDMSKMKWKQFADIAASRDVSIPSIIQKHKVGVGLFDLTKLVADDDKPGAEKSEKSYFIKVTPYDHATRRFGSVKDDKYAQDLTAQLQKSIDRPDIKKEMKDPNTLFGNMASLVQVLARGKIKSLLIYGGPGIGKTFVVTETLANEKLVKNRDYYVMKGKVTPASLYQNLFLHRKGGILLFDDTDSVWGDQDAANILKAALDSYDTRTISWFSARTVNTSKMTDEEKEEFNDNLDLKIKADPGDPKIKFPSEFEYEGRICFISNLTVDKFDSAVLNRSVKIDMTLNQDQLFDRMENILQHLGDKDISMDIKHEILAFIKKSVGTGDIASASMRTYVAAESLYNSGVPNWKELLEYI